MALLNLGHLQDRVDEFQFVILSFRLHESACGVTQTLWIDQGNVGANVSPGAEFR